MALLEQVRGASGEGRGAYDAVLAYSGGKDSTYTLRLLKEKFDLQVLSITFDHGFVSPAALANIKNICDALEIDHLAVRPAAAALRDVFVRSMRSNIYPPAALERASGICNSCMNMVKSFLLKTALEMKIPLIAYGWSPGQAPVRSAVLKTNASMIERMQKAAAKPLQEMAGDRLTGFLLTKRHFENLSGENGLPHYVHPLAFLKYDEDEILRSIQEIGWVNPADTDSNSTNCLLNGFANQFHQERFGFHPYALEVGGLVRQGYMTRDEGLKKLAAPPDPEVLAYVNKQLGLAG